MSSVLVGKREIRDYLRMGWDKVMHLRRTERLPVVKIADVWQSDATLLDQWRRDKINGILKPPTKNPPSSKTT